MSHVFGLRISVERLAVAAMTVVGIGVGYGTGCGLAILQSTRWLDHYAEAAAVRTDASVAEARSALETLGASTHVPCSEADLAAFRKLVFRFDNIKDAGRLLNGKIECSAVNGRAQRAIGSRRPDARFGDGTLAYSNLDPAQDAGLKRAALELNDRFVIFGANQPSSPGPVPMRLSVAMIGDPGQRPAEGPTREGRTLSFSRCTSSHLSCATASTSVGEILHSQSSMMTASALAGGLLGVLLGLGFAELYRQRHALPRQLRRAVNCGRLRQVYQPIVNLATQQIVGAEALSRWTDEDGNVVSPDSFIKIAEEAGFITSITRMVIHRSLEDFAEVFHARPEFRLSINVSASDLVDPGFLPTLDRSLRQARVKPQNLVIEITERSAADSEVAMETLRQLRHRGHSIHIDDFGTGYSNLDKLLYLFADTIKIDKAFTSVIGTESVAAAILPQILTMAKSLNLEVVVEGVETARQADYFAPGEQKIYAQGWLYGHAVSAEAFMALLDGEHVLVPMFAEDVSAFTTKPGALQIVGSMVA